MLVGYGWLFYTIYYDSILNSGASLFSLKGFLSFFFGGSAVSVFMIYEPDYIISKTSAFEFIFFSNFYYVGIYCIMRGSNGSESALLIFIEGIFILRLNYI